MSNLKLSSGRMLSPKAQACRYQTHFNLYSHMKARGRGGPADKDQSTSQHSRFPSPPFTLGGGSLHPLSIFLLSFEKKNETFLLPQSGSHPKPISLYSVSKSGWMSIISIRKCSVKPLVQRATSDWETLTENHWQFESPAQMSKSFLRCGHTLGIS